MPRKTMIANVTTHLVDRHCFVRVTSEDGHIGTGQTAYFGFPHLTPPVLDGLSGVLLGQDPDEIGRLWLEMFRNVPVRGGAFTSTIAAVDLALWDLKGRRYEVPAYELMGGRQRSKVRAHILLGMTSWPRSSTREELLLEAKQAVNDGFTAVKFDPLLEGEDGFHTQSHSRRTSEVVGLVADMRTAVGRDVDIILEIHRKLAAAEAVVLADALVPYDIYMYEDAMPPDSVSEWSRLAARIRLPLGVGERADTIYEFEDLLNAGVGDFLRPDVGTAGGLSHCLKIAALAEARHRRVICHNFLSPFLTGATLQLYAAVPNVGTFEWSPLDEMPPRDKMLVRPLERDGGWLPIPDGPGLGVELAADYLAGGPAFQPPRPPGSLRLQDGGIHAR